MKASFTSTFEHELTTGGYLFSELQISCYIKHILTICSLKLCFSLGRHFRLCFPDHHPILELIIIKQFLHFNFLFCFLFWFDELRLSFLGCLFALIDKHKAPRQKKQFPHTMIQSLKYPSFQADNLMFCSLFMGRHVGTMCKWLSLLLELLSCPLFSVISAPLIPSASRPSPAFNIARLCLLESFPEFEQIKILIILFAGWGLVNDLSTN